MDKLNCIMIITVCIYSLKKVVRRWTK